ncbi:MAG: cell division protein FtsQ/DivIB [Neisseriaceae bacterium]|nr:cell division protein FtsQ/DivIB [Neisseriaceae bacterium]
MSNIQLQKIITHFLMISAGIGLCLTYVVYTLKQPDYQVKKIAFQGELTKVSKAELQQVSASVLKGNIVNIDLNAVRAGFERLPWVQSAEVRRSWPDKIIVSLLERTPFARWDEVALLDTRGQPFVAQTNKNLPYLFGPAGTSVEVMNMYQRYNTLLKPTGLAIEEIWYSERHAVRLILSNALVVELGSKEQELRLSRFSFYWLKHLALLPYRYQYVDMRYSRGFSVKVQGKR